MSGFLIRHSHSHKLFFLRDCLAIYFHLDSLGRPSPMRTVGQSLDSKDMVRMIYKRKDLSGRRRSGTLDLGAKTVTFGYIEEPMLLRKQNRGFASRERGYAYAAGAAVVKNGGESVVFAIALGAPVRVYSTCAIRGRNIRILHLTVAIIVLWGSEPAMGLVHSPMYI